jgi:hypothetical protein
VGTVQGCALADGDGESVGGMASPMASVARTFMNFSLAGQ